MRPIIIVACAWLAAACGSPKPTAPPTPDPGPTVPPATERISGTERLGWSQDAASAEELGTFRYLIYVDAVANEAQGVTCSSTPGPAGFACTARLPPMTAGQHALTMSSFIESGGTRLESPRSPAVNVLLVSQSTSSRPDAGGAIVTIDGVRLQPVVVSEGFDDAADFDFAPDGRLFVAERGGRVRVVRGGRLVAKPALTLTDVGPAVTGGLLGIAVDPDYARNKFVYLVYTTARGFRFARVRAVGDTLGDRAILLDEVPAASGATAALRFGPDRRVYLGLDDGGDARRASDRGSFNGKILRLTAEATTPPDQPGFSPLYVSDVRRPRSLAWGAKGSALWVLDLGGSPEGLLESSSGAGTIVSRYTLPAEARASSLVMYRGDLIQAFREHLLVAAPGEMSVLRMTLDPGNPFAITATERLTHALFDGVRALGVGPDGAIYLITPQTLVRLSPS